MQSLKDLLPDALRRGRISREISATRVVEVFNELLLEKLPSGHASDLLAISFKDGVLNVGCKNSPAAHWLFVRQADFLSILSRRLPEIRVEKIKTKIRYDF
jgi:hypothetical protein